MSIKIQEALEKKFQVHDVIFWYDERNELKESFDDLDLKGVEKCHIPMHQNLNPMRIGY